MLGATATTLAVYGAYAMRPVRVPEDLAIAAFATDLQTSNRAAKANRLAMRQREWAVAAAGPASDTMALAEAEPVSVEPVQPESGVTAKSSPADVTKVASLALPPPLPPEKPKRLLPPPPAAPSAPPAPAAGLLDDSQIAGLRGRLRLTSEQAEYWPAVEAALRDVARTQLHGLRRKIAQGGHIAIDINTPEVQKLIWAAMPLLARLREDQKREVRKIARVMGFEQIASQI